MQGKAINRHSLWCDKKYEWEIVTWVQIIEMLKRLRKRKILKESHLISLVLMLVVLDVLQWIQFTFPRQKEKQKKDPKLFMIPINQLKQET